MKRSFASFAVVAKKAAPSTFPAVQVLIVVGILGPQALVLDGNHHSFNKKLGNSDEMTDSRSTCISDGGEKVDVACDVGS